MRDMYEGVDRWGAWAAADSSGVDWQLHLPDSKGFCHMVRNHAFSVMMMKGS
jgi:hypothetical protein